MLCFFLVVLGLMFLVRTVQKSFLKFEMAKSQTSDLVLAVFKLINKRLF